MTKSIEEQAEEFAIENRGYDFFKDEVPFAIDMKNCFLAGAKARDAQWLEVVSELREALNNIIGERVWSCESCIKHQNISRESLTKADQMLKEMNINKGEENVI